MPEDPGHRPSPVLDDLIRRTRSFLAEVAYDYLRRPLDDLLRWALGRAAVYLVAAGIFVTAAVLLLVAGVKGLESAGVSPALSHLALGLAGAAGAFALLRLGRPRKPR